MDLVNRNKEALRNSIENLNRISQIIANDRQKIVDLDSNNVIKVAGYMFVHMYNSILYSLMALKPDIHLYVAILNQLTWAFVGSIFYGTIYSNLMNRKELRKEIDRLSGLEIVKEHEVQCLMEKNRIASDVYDYFRNLNQINVYDNKQDSLAVICQEIEEGLWSNNVQDLRALKFCLLNKFDEKKEKSVIYHKVK